MRLTKNITFILSLSLLTGFVSISAQAGNVKINVVGGTEVVPDITKPNSTVLIVGETKQPDGTSGQYICTGSLISQNVIITAAHCVSEDPLLPVDSGKLVIVFNNNVNTATKQDLRRISGYVAHPQWLGVNQPTMGTDVHDIALIRFIGTLPPGYAPSKLLPNSSVLLPGQEVLLAGYGITGPLNQDSAGILREARVNIVQDYGLTEIVLDSSKGKGACSGDSGGPAFIDVQGQRYLWGVTSRADQDCAVGSIYTKISAYNDFVVGAQQQLESQVGTPTISKVSGL